MNVDDLREILSKDDQCNFIAMAITPLHAAGIDATISYLNSYGVDLKGYVLMTAHPDTGRVVDKSFFHNNESSIQYIDFEYTEKKEKGLFNSILDILRVYKCCVKKAKYRNMYIVWTDVYSKLLVLSAQIMKRRDIVVIQIDDGAASYENDYARRIGVLRYKSQGLINKIMVSVKAGVFATASIMLKSALKHNNRYINGSIFYRVFKNKKWVIERNSVWAEYYAQAFKGNDIEANLFEIYCDSIVINTQCLVECNMINGYVDEELFSELNEVLRSIKCKVVLKPHPRERNTSKYDKFEWIKYEGTYSQETIIANLCRRPKCIISVFSSTLLNAYGLFGIPSISLAKIMLAKDIADGFRKELELYVKTYENIIIFPKTFLELKSILDSYICEDSQQNNLLKE